MPPSELSNIYRAYIACLNTQDWASLERFVHRDVSHNGNRIGLDGYREMLERDYQTIPDLHFEIELLVAEPPRVASRLRFNCTPREVFLGLNTGGRTVSFAENVFYEFADGKIREVWSVIDKTAIEAQLS